MAIKVPDRGVYLVSGELDLGSAEQFRHSMEPALDAAGEVVIDLAEVTFIDSFGLRSIALLARMVGQRGVVLRYPQDPFLRVLELIDLEESPGSVSRDGDGKGLEDLVAGSGLISEDRGARHLKGVPDEWRVRSDGGLQARLRIVSGLALRRLWFLRRCRLRRCRLLGLLWWGLHRTSFLRLVDQLAVQLSSHPLTVRRPAA